MLIVQILIRNPCIRVAQRIHSFGMFAQDDSVNIPRLFELYVLSCMLNGVRMDPRAIFAR